MVIDRLWNDGPKAYARDDDSIEAQFVRSEITAADANYLLYED